MTRYVVAPNGVPSPLLTHMMNKRTEEERKAPCARQCEAQAFKIELRQKDSRIAELEAEVAALKPWATTPAATLGALAGKRMAELEAQNKQLLEALKGLLQDTQHAEHDCGDEEWCPVIKARAAIAQVEGK